MEFLGFTLDVATLTNNALSIAAKVALALLIFMIGRWLAKKAVTFAHGMMLRSRLDETVASFLGRLIYGVLLVVVVLAALSKVGVQTTSVVAILGGAAVAIGLSLKDQLSNFAAGIMIVTFRPFVRGDYVQISSYTGTVTEITLVNTHLQRLTIMMSSFLIAISPLQRLSITPHCPIAASISLLALVMMLISKLPKMLC